MSTANDRRGFILRYYAPAVLFAALIFVVSSFPGKQLPDMHFRFSDKVAHFFEFGIFAILLYRAFNNGAKVKFPFAMTLLTGMLYAAFDEMHQAFVPGRFSDTTDFLADTVGLLFWGGVCFMISAVRNTGGTPQPDSDQPSA